MSRLALFTTALLAASIPFVDAGVTVPHNFKVSFGDPHGISPPASGGVTQAPKVIRQSKVDQVIRTEFSIPPQVLGLYAKPPVGQTFTPVARPFASIAGVTTGKGTTYKPAGEGSSAAKRNLDLQGTPCTTVCGFNDRPRPNPSDCEVVYRTLYNHAVAFDSRPNTFVSWTYNSCSAFFINNSRDTITYDQWDYGGVAQWLNGDCINDGASIGTCLFSRYSDYSNGAYISINNPIYFG